MISKRTYKSLVKNISDVSFALKTSMRNLRTESGHGLTKSNIAHGSAETEKKNIIFMEKSHTYKENTLFV